MPSILANSYTASVMLPSLMPVPRTDNDIKSPATKADSVAATESVRVASDRVSAFLATDQASQSNRTRPDGPPPPPNGDARGPGGSGNVVGQSGSTDESESALILLETAETGTENTHDTAANAPSQAVTILMDEAKIYQPSSLY